jgi:hypothetical protein
MPESLSGPVERVTYHSSENGFAVLRVKVGEPAAIESLLKASTGTTGTDALERLIPDAGKGTLLAAKVDPSAFLGAVEQAGEQAAPLRSLFQAESWSLRMNADDGLRLTLRAEFAKPEAAAQAQPALRAVLDHLEEFLQLAGERMPEFLKSQGERFESAP